MSCNLDPHYLRNPLGGSVTLYATLKCCAYIRIQSGMQRCMKGQKRGSLTTLSSSRTLKGNVEESWSDSEESRLKKACRY